ncbi:MAG: sensor histidine kinase [Gemmatimonadota bacterium]
MARTMRLAHWWRARSIEWKLPATFTLLLALLVGFYVFAAYRAVEQGALEAARQRVERVGAELVQLVTMQNQQRSELFAELAKSRAVQSALAGERRANLDSVFARLRISSDSSAILLLDAETNVLAQSGNPAAAAALDQLGRTLRAAAEQPGQMQRSPFFLENGIAYYWSAATVDAGASGIGFLAQLRRLGNANSSGSRALEQLMGDALVFFTNADDATWLHIDGAPAAPPAVESLEHGAILHRRADSSYLARSGRIPNTPWIIVAETPVAAARARALTFVGKTTPVAIAVILIGAGLAWLVARRFTEVRRINAQLEDRVRQRTAELEAANRELRSFSYSVSHDLRSPLRSMDGFSQALLEDYGDSLDETGKDYLVRVRNGAQRMGHLIDDLLTLSKVTLEPIEREAVDVSALARELIDELRQSEPRRAAEISIQDGLHLRADRGLLRIALQNLLSNAWKFSAGSAPARIEVGSTNGEIFVRDNGVGFDMRYAGKLFTPFQRLHPIDQFTGTGIGLATVQRVIARHGGGVRAEAAEHKGATFFFSIDGGERSDAHDSSG